MAAKAKRRGRRHTIVKAGLVGAVMVGLGMFVGGALAARDTELGGEDINDEDLTTSSSTAPSTTERSTTTTTAPTTTTTAPVPPGADGTLEPGEHGDEITLLQGRLNDLGFWLGSPDGAYGQLTRQAVMAFQKAEGLGRDGVAGPATLAALQVAGRPTPREPAGSHVEIDLDRQIILVVQDGQVRWALNTSTGSGEAYAAPSGGSAVATTPRGTFTIEREIDGLRRAPLGTLYRPKYFHGGIAIHGAGQIPAHPASHGCARVTNSAMDLLWSSGVTAIGTTVLVY